MIVADTSVLVPAVLANHEFHEACHESAGLVDAAVAHALIEMYSVLTRLPQPFTVPPTAAIEAVESYGTTVIGVPDSHVLDVVRHAGSMRIVGGATYDALIAATAQHHEATLLTRDERAARTYERLGADVRWVAT